MSEHQKTDSASTGLEKARERGREAARHWFNEPKNLLPRAAAQLVNLTEDALSELRRSGQYYALADVDTGALRYPMWQFHVEKSRMKEYLAPFVANESSGYIIHQYSHRPKRELSELSPRDYLIKRLPMDRLMVLVGRYLDHEQGAS